MHVQPYRKCKICGVAHNFAPPLILGSTTIGEVECVSYINTVSPDDASNWLADVYDAIRRKLGRLILSESIFGDPTMLWRGGKGAISRGAPLLLDIFDQAGARKIAFQCRYDDGATRDRT